MSYTSLKYCLILVMMFTASVIISCGRSENAKQEDATATTDAVTPYATLEELYELDAQASKKITDWKAYWELEREMKNFRATRSGDLGFITDELIRIEDRLINDSILEEVNVSAVKSRALVFKTFTKKLKDQLNHRVPTSDIDSTRFRIMESYNAFRYQVSDALREKVYEDFLDRDSLEIDVPGPSLDN